MLLEHDEASRAATPPIDALQHARTCLETALERHEAWRALKQLQAREDVGEWLDVMESDVLRDRLLQAIASDPDFMAWQFVDAAMACLDANAKSRAVGPAMLSAQSDAPVALKPVPPPASLSEHAMAEPAILPYRLEPLPLPRDPNSKVLVPPMRGLSLRIPTLQRHDMRAAEAIAPSLAGGPAERASGDAVVPLAVSAMAHDRERSFGRKTALQMPPAPSDDDDTRFDAHAIGIEEADVQIVVRSTKPTPIIETRLPPLPLTEPGQKLPRASRASNLKWSDEDEARDGYRPVSSAMDEAQVTIIAVGAQSEAETRATRRALGIAPDRENQMRRFFKALAGDELPPPARDADVTVASKHD